MRIALIALSLVCAPAFAQVSALAHGQVPPEPRRAELVNMVRQDCGSCHGLTMTGGLGPPLLPEAIATRDPELMRAVILYGLRGTAMPPWRPFLSDAEAAWIVKTLKEGLPDER